MNRVFALIGVGIAIVALMFLSQGIKKAAPTDEDLQKQAQEESQTANQKAAPPAPSPKPVAPTKPGLLTPTLPAEETVGNPALAKHHIQVGWVYDEANQANPNTLTVPLEAVRDFVQRSGGAVSSEIVNLDVPAVDRTAAAQSVTELGMTVDGKPVVTENLSDKPFSSQQITQMLAAASK